MFMYVVVLINYVNYTVPMYDTTTYKAITLVVAYLVEYSSLVWVLAALRQYCHLDTQEILFKCQILIV